MIPQQTGFCPENTGTRLWTELVPLAGGAQWKGTRQEQNDILYFSQYEPLRGMLIVLADGIGLDDKAGRAAKLAVAAAREEFEHQEPTEEMHRRTLYMAGAAQKAVRAMKQEKQGKTGSPIGAAAVFALIQNRRLAFSSVGNVRIFLIRANCLLQLNRDHLLSLEAEEKDILGGGEPAIDPEWAKRVTAYIGMDDLQKIDCQQTPVFLVPEDRILIMSSGLYGILDEDELCSLVSCSHPQQAAEAIINRVRELGHPSQSNVSAAVIRFGLSTV